MHFSGLSSRLGSSSLIIAMKPQLVVQIILFALAATTTNAAASDEHHEQQLAHDACLTDAQCLNGGTCLKQSEDLVREPGEYNRCDCKDSFGGLRCESFCPLECQNGGICHTLQKSPAAAAAGRPIDPAHTFSSSYACKCLGLWTGTVCDQPYENCGNGVQCFNGGRCALLVQQSNGEAGEYRCDCPLGYGGKSCRDSVPVTMEKEKWGILDAVLIFDSRVGNVLWVLVLLATPVFIAYVFHQCKRRRAKYKSLVSDEGDSDRALEEYEFSSSIRGQAERWRNIV